MSVSAKWSTGLLFEGVSASGQNVQLSGDPQTGFKPLELMLVSLAGCTGMDVISILEKKRQNVTHFSVDVSGERQEEHPRVYTSIHIKYVVTGVALDPAAVERAVELSETKYCPAQAMLSKAAEITHEIEIINEN